MKKRKTLPPRKGGLGIITTGVLPHKGDTTVEYVHDYFICKTRPLENHPVDFIKVHYNEFIRYSDGGVITVNAKSYKVSDEKGVYEYDTYTETIYAQEDIDNPDYTVIKDDNDNITSIQKETKDENGNVVIDEDTGEALMEEVQPIQRKGDIDPLTEVLISGGDEPLHDWHNLIYAAANAAIVGQMKYRNGH